MESSLLDSWSRRAASVGTERRPDEEDLTNYPGSRLKAVGLGAEELARLEARGVCARPGTARRVEKNGRLLARPGSAPEFKAPQAGGGMNSALQIQELAVTPELAARWLKNNFRNRPVSEDVVKAYARDMAAGQWVFTHQGIAFNDRDELIDGQHRLRAIVASGVTVRMMVTFGLPSAIAGREMTTMDCVDRGRTRSVADQLKIQHGLKEGSVIAAVTSSLAGLCTGERVRRLSVGQTLSVFREFEGPMEWMMEGRSKEKGLRAAGVLAGFVFASAPEFKASPNGIQNWFTALNSEGLKKGSALGRLRELLRDQAVLLTHGMNRGLAELVCQALWLEGRGRPGRELGHGLEGTEFFRAGQRERVERVGKVFRTTAKV